MPTSTTIDYSIATLSFLMGKLEGILAGLNTDIAAYIDGGPAPVFTTVLGTPTTLDAPALALDYNGDLPPRRAAFNEKLIGLSFKVQCILPVAGGDSPSNFAVAKARARDFVTTLFDQDVNSLTPKIDAGLIGVCYAFQGERGEITSIDGMVLDDQVTKVRGWQMSYSVWYSLTTR